MSGATDGYREFLSRKVATAPKCGIEPTSLPACMKPHQIDSTAFALRTGRAGLYLDTGLGKTLCELEFCRQAAEATNGKALILTPLAVAKQFEREAKKFGIDARVIRQQSEARDGINICNYDRLEKLEPDAFGAISLDESSILKSFSGATSRALRQTFAAHRFRLSATATPAPNDHMELGQHASFLSVMDSAEMLSRWFITDQTEMGRYRLKGHAERSFWDWMASWAVMAESPADLGHDASEYFLPPLEVIRHATGGHVDLPKEGLFAADANATNIHEIKRATSDVRADAIAEQVSGEREQSWVIWCDTNYEADRLSERLPDVVEVRGSMSIDEKEEKLEAFATGQAKDIITKPSIGGFGTNWQHAARMAFIGRSFSYETWYQAVRRCWRFGQKRPVHVHLAVAEGEDQIGRVIERKSADHIRMKRMMSAAMRRALGREAFTKVAYDPQHYAELPAWLMAS
jgi:superfamily II DNA or RNA helicase